ncbi:MAG: outer membrane protein assembly factor BamA [bacterium]
MFNEKTIKIIVFLLIPAAVLFGNFPKLFAEEIKIIREIEVSGNSYIKKRTILSQVDSRKGDLFSEQTLKLDVQKIFNLGYFEDVAVETEDLETDDGEVPAVRVIFAVVEKPKIEKIIFIGNKKFSKSSLRGEIDSKAGESLDTITLSSDEEKIKDKYREKGYADVEVEHFIKESEKKESRIVLTFYITEGNRILIKEVKVVGVTQYKTKKIKKLMKTKRKKVFKQENLDLDIAKIYDFYKNRGFLNVNITEPVISYNAERTGLFIEFEINEGRKYKINSYEFSGNTVYSEKELKDVVVIKTNRLFKEETYQDTIRNIQELYANKGYLRVDVAAKKITDDEKGIVDIVFEIRENEVVYVDRIYVDGNLSTKEKVIRREILIKEGEPFSAIKVRRSFERIMNLGFMDDVQIDIQQPRALDRADLVFEVTEGKPGVLSAGAGFSSVDGVLGTMSVSHINLFGRAQKLNLMWEFGERRQSYDISFTEPWIFDKPVSFGVDIFDTVRRRQYGDDPTAYRERRRGGGIRVGPRFSDIYSAFFNYSYENIRVFDIDQDLADQISASDDVTSSLTPQIVRDTRDNVFDPTRGSRNSLAVQVAGGPFGGDINFCKPILKSSWFFPTFWKFVFSLNLETGAVKHFLPSKEVPIFERFYVGGSDSIRGYDYRGEIGPFEGGNVMAVLNAEYKFPIVQEKRRTILQGAFFLDVGNAWRSSKDVDLRIGSQDEYMKAGVGFGIRFKTPVFPIRLDWGYGLNHQPGEDLSQFYFTIGNIF